MKKILLAVLIIYAGTANATVFSVTNANDAGAGSLRQAITNANADAASPHTININVAGTVLLNSNLPVISKSITINGAVPGGSTISGNQLYSIFNFTGTNLNLLSVSLNDLELKDAFTSSSISGDGGSAIHGIYLQNAIINRCYIHDCKNVVTGSGTFLTIHGGAVSVNSMGSCSTTRNFYMRQTTIAYNLLSGTNSGGFMEAYGAGVFAQAFNDTIVNCTFFGNKVIATTNLGSSQATATGGGMAFYGCGMSVNHASFVSDTAEAINTAGGSSTSGAGGLSTVKYAINISNSLADLNMAGNSPDIGSLSNGMGEIISGGYNVIGTLGGAWSSVKTTDSVNKPSGVQPLGSNGFTIPTCGLTTTSPAFNMVLSGVLLLTDGRNFSRDSKPDAGAYELNGAVLPLKLLSFNAVKCNHQVCLSWRTSEEINTSTFTIQRSKDGATFNNIDIIKAWGTGNHDYTAADPQVTNGTSFYRLLMNDKDGKSRYSPVVKINLSSAAGMAVSPNPANEYFSITNPIHVQQIVLLQNDGRIIKQWTAVQGNKYFTSNILQGIYMVKIVTTTGIESHKLIIAKQ